MLQCCCSRNGDGARSADYLSGSGSSPSRTRIWSRMACEVGEAAGADALGALHQVFDLVVLQRGQGVEVGVDGVFGGAVEEVADRHPEQLGQGGEEPGGRVVATVGAQVRQVHAGHGDAVRFERLRRRCRWSSARTVVGAGTVANRWLSLSANPGMPSPDAIPPPHVDLVLVPLVSPAGSAWHNLHGFDPTNLSTSCPQSWHSVRPRAITAVISRNGEQLRQERSDGGEQHGTATVGYGAGRCRSS